MKKSWMICLVVTAIGFCAAGWADDATTATAPSEPDPAIAAAEKYVADHPDRYLHHLNLHRGDKGYGLTVMAGETPVRFDVEIVTVMTAWGPHQDVILAKLTGQNLETSGIIAGMSGSPCYIAGPDGKSRLIGAVAYGWAFPKEPLCGIQPITQMLAVAGIGMPATTTTTATSNSAASEPATQPASTPAEKSGRLTSQARSSGGEDAQRILRAALSPEKIDFRELMSGPERFARPGVGVRGADSPALRPLTVPLMVRGMPESMMASFSRQAAAVNLRPVQAGGTASAPATQKTALTPGGAVSIPLVRGDVDFSGVGTVTEIIGDNVLIFGHGMYQDGEVELPMGPAVVHTVVSGYKESFKLAAALDPVGAITHDEATAVTGVLGKKAAMIPMDVTVHWKKQALSQKFHYELIREWFWTPRLTLGLIDMSVSGWHSLPQEHTIRYSMEIDFGKVGAYKAANVSSGSALWELCSDAGRPVLALVNNPFGKRIYPERISVEVTVEEGNTTAGVLAFTLDGTIYRPGETITGTVTLRDEKQKDHPLQVTFALPEDLPEGTYSLTAGGMRAVLSDMARRKPHLYNPKSPEELLTALQRIVEPQGNVVHLLLGLPDRGGMALDRKELPSMPPSKAKLISQANPIDTTVFGEAIYRSIAAPFTILGSRDVTFQVVRETNKTILRP